MNKFWLVVNGIIAIGAFIIVTAMVFFDYTPSRVVVIISILTVGLNAISQVVDYRNKYWQERKAEAERESRWLDAMALAKKEGRTLPNERETL